MSDPKQLISNAIRWMDSVIPEELPDDNVLIINALVKLKSIPDANTQGMFFEIIQLLRSRNTELASIYAARKDTTGEELSKVFQINDKERI